MKTVENYLIIMFSIMFFIFRLVVVFCETIEVEFIIDPINVEHEIILLFIMAISIILISRNKVLGSIVMMLSTSIYFGPTLVSQMQTIISGRYDQTMVLEVIISLIGIIIPFFSLIILILAKKQEKKPVDRQTDFFYKNEAYDRNLDERADKNNYRLM